MSIIYAINMTINTDLLAWFAPQKWKLLIQDLTADFFGESLNIETFDMDYHHFPIKEEAG